MGALWGFIHARETGIVRGIGGTGHHNPEILLHAVPGLDIDAVLPRINPVGAALGGFRMILAARDRGHQDEDGGRPGTLLPDAGLPSENLIRSALSEDLDMVIWAAPRPQRSARRDRETIPAHG